MPEPAEQAAKPRTWRPMVHWTAGILLALGLAWFVAAVVVPYFRVRAFMTGGAPSREDISRLGGPEKTARWIVWYLRLPKVIAPRSGYDLWGWGELRQHVAPCLIQLMREEDGDRLVAAYLLGGVLAVSAHKPDWDQTEPDVEPRVFDEGVLALASALRDSDEDVRYTAARALGWIGPRAAPAIPALEPLAEDGGGDKIMRLAVLDALGKIRAEDPPE